MMPKQSYKASYDSRIPLLTLKDNYKDKPTTYPPHLAVIKTNQQHTQHIWQHRPFLFRFFFYHSYTNVQRRRYATTLAAIGFFTGAKTPGMSSMGMSIHATVARRGG